jgi:ketosteroid isomerase-like protein
MRYLVLFSFLFILLSCNHITQPAEIDAISKVLYKQAEAWNRGDIDGYMKGYLKSDSLRFASGGGVSYGWEVTLNRYKKGYPSKTAMGRLTFSDIDIQIISSDAALVFGKWELEREADHPWGLFSLLFRKTSEGWRIVHDHTSSAK